MFETTIYANYGVLAHDKETVFTATAPHAHADFAEKITVIIPDQYEPYETQSGEVALSVPNGFNPYLLSEVLVSGKDGGPWLRYVDRDGHYHQYALDCPIPVND